GLLGVGWLSGSIRRPVVRGVLYLGVLVAGLLLFGFDQGQWGGVGYLVGQVGGALLFLGVMAGLVSPGAPVYREHRGARRGAA
ncbi:MAG: hypothetical protein ACOY93_03265, partial [Bacillota bacterium]